MAGLGRAAGGSPTAPTATPATRKEGIFHFRTMRNPFRRWESVRRVTARPPHGHRGHTNLFRYFQTPEKNRNSVYKNYLKILLPQQNFRSRPQYFVGTIIQLEKIIATVYFIAQTNTNKINDCVRNSKEQPCGPKNA